jgi:hypothetical protein
VRRTQPTLAQMDGELMPPDLVCRHGLPAGCSIGHAARSVICLLGPDGEEYRLDMMITFGDERESSEWWAKNRDNPHRVVVKDSENGIWSVQIA